MEKRTTTKALICGAKDLARHDWSGAVLVKFTDTLWGRNGRTITVPALGKTYETHDGATALVLRVCADIEAWVAVTYGVKCFTSPSADLSESNVAITQVFHGRPDVETAEAHLS